MPILNSKGSTCNAEYAGFERLKGRMARGPQVEEIDCKCHRLHVFSLSLKQQEETNYKCQTFFPPSLYKIKRFLLNFCVAIYLVPPELNFSQTYAFFLWKYFS